MAAFERALQDGADGLEFDVRLARDHVPVVIHDATLRRTARRDGAIAALTSVELSKADAGTWFNLRFPAKARAEYTRERVPSLTQVFEVFGVRCRVLYVEMKCETAEEMKPLAAEVVKLVHAHSLVDHVVVESFALDAIKEVKQIAPELRTAALFDRKLSRPFPSMREILTQAIASGADELALHHSLVTRRIVAAARRQGMNSLAWTVDHPSWIRGAIDTGLCAIITNQPARMRASLDGVADT